MSDDNPQTALDFTGQREPEHLDTKSLESWLWDAACAIRGGTDAPKFKDFILPPRVSKRIFDVFDDEFAAQVDAFGSEDAAQAMREVARLNPYLGGRRDRLQRAEGGAAGPGRRRARGPTDKPAE